MHNARQATFERWGLNSLLKSQRGLSLKPSSKNETKVAGELEFTAKQNGFEEISDCYSIELCVPSDFPKNLPTVTELQGRIPKTFHTQPHDGTLCLGSPSRLMWEVKKSPNLPAFLEKCVIPYLYGYSHKERYGGELPQGELPHGRKGLLRDYCSLFNIPDENKCLNLIKLASIKKRVANKRDCFCGISRRLGKCHNRKVNSVRRKLGRKWLAQEYDSLK